MGFHRLHNYLHSWAVLYQCKLYISYLGSRSVLKLDALERGKIDEIPLVQ